MLDLRPFDLLGRYDGSWLQARYHFSFADYHDADRMGLGTLRVWNDDTIQPDGAFPLHGHRDMEIVTYVHEGAVTHEDSLGNQGRVEAGQVQVMSAGSGIRHSEANREPTPTRLFQIWIRPERTGLPPRWETRSVPRRHGTIEVLASGFPEDEGGPALFQRARVLAATLDSGGRVEWALRGRPGYLVPARGVIRAGGIVVGERCGLAVTGEESLVLDAEGEAEVVMVEAGA